MGHSETPPDDPSAASIAHLRPDSGAKLRYTDLREITDAGNQQPAVSIPVSALRYLGIGSPDQRAAVLDSRVQLAVYDDGTLVIDLPSREEL